MPINVFISYSHDSDAHRERVLDLSNRLRADRIDCWIDQYEPAPAEGWPHKMDRGIREADFVLMACTETYLKRLQLEEEEGKGLGVAWEGSLIYNTLYRECTLNSKFIPILFTSDDKPYIPTILFGNSHYDLSLPRGYEHLYRHLRGELGAVMPPLGKKRFVRTIHSDALPTVEGELFGRKDELALLDEALGNADTHIVQFIASGGTGKTKLIRHWLDGNHHKIEALIAWSFYSQGSSEDKQISATTFFMQALKSLRSDKDISDFKTEEEKGEYIADLVRERRCLLVLDGLEPLQQVGRGMRGELKDRALRKMLRCLAGYHSSLCIITTRLPVHELKGRRHVVSHDLQNLTPEDGVALLLSLHVHGGRAYKNEYDQLFEAVQEYGCHALSINLLGNAVRIYLQGNVLLRYKIPDLIDGDGFDASCHAFKVMNAYSNWLSGTVELRLLHLLSLFDHPVCREELEVLWAAKVKGLSDGVTDGEWMLAFSRLCDDYKILYRSGSDNEFFDCHPLVREFFNVKFRNAMPVVYKDVNLIYFEYYKKLPEKEYPKGLDEMQPLFKSILHGCNAGLHNESLEIYWLRVQDQLNYYLLHDLGAFNDALSVEANFFVSPWNEVVDAIDNKDKAETYARVGYILQSLGRLEEAVEPNFSAFGVFKALSEWKDASAVLNNITNLYCCMGSLKEALGVSEECVKFAEMSHDLEEVRDGLYALSAAAFFYGEYDRANITLERALSAQVEKYKDALHHCGLPNFIDYHINTENRICTAEYISRMESSLEEDWYNYIDLAYDQLIISISYLNDSNFVEASQWAREALENIRQAGNQDEIPNVLIHCSDLVLNGGEFNLAHEYLREAYEIAEPSGMRLYLTDYHLEMARLILAVEADSTQYPEATPGREQRILPFADQEEPGILTLEGHISTAAKLIKDTGYHRRDTELTELKQQAGMPC